MTDETVERPKALDEMSDEEFEEIRASIGTRVEG